MATHSLPVFEKSTGLIGYFANIKRDIDSALERDPAARSRLEIMLLYPGLHAVWIHRITHWLWSHKARLPARWLSHWRAG